MIRRVDRRPMRPLAAALLLGAGLSAAGAARAQGLGPSAGFAPLPSLAWPGAAQDAPSRWTGSYATLSTGYAAVSSGRFGSFAGPTLGLEAGRMWQAGPILYGISGGLDYLAGLEGGLTPGFGRLTYTRDLAGALEAKVGMLLGPDVVVYAKTGAVAAHETLRAGPSAFAPPLTRQDVAVRPVAGVGVEWAVTDRLSLAVEAGVVGNGVR